ncbi:50S ribosomal protein L6 [Dethiosulfatarculus sandiegensis]|jgi:large subunit ribosomal protein L6|uniref:Large ribosomal subunit protein uL6 n=1 Tax=Dethiosulfatarculus sandiegensis TaxID=1429043 RepID=A0A0D2I0E5_9BACT|nr:50S ribosomal protein L6 [Dethiosulfatarculus sandiegensis]KIX15968.1 50S ribosomal protein L6 [Dethiosulfatarculus sandiegensis]
MSRIGKLPVALPQGVEAKVTGQTIEVKGPKGALTRTFHQAIKIIEEESSLRFEPREEGKDSWALWGLCRSLLFNMVQGVNEGYTKVLEINGVGYKAELAGQTLKLALGFSHPVEFEVPKDVAAQVDKAGRITLTSIDKELLGQTAATIRGFRPPEPYKGKGIKYADEEIRRKVGKAGVK